MDWGIGVQGIGVGVTYARQSLNQSPDYPITQLPNYPITRLPNYPITRFALRADFVEGS